MATEKNAKVSTRNESANGMGSEVKALVKSEVPQRDGWMKDSIPEQEA